MPMRSGHLCTVATIFLLATCLWGIVYGSADTTLSYTWQNGDEYIYHVIFQDRSVLPFPGRGSDQGVSYFLLDGVLKLHCYGEQSGGEVRFGAQFLDISRLNVNLNGKNIITGDPSTVFQNGGEIILDFSANGRLSHIFTPPHGNGIQIRLAASVAGELQAILPPDSNSTRWKIPETHYYGRADAEYQIVSRENSRMYVKKTVLVSSPLARQKQAYETDGTRKFIYSIALDQNGWIDELKALSASPLHDGKIGTAASGTSITIRLLKASKAETAGNHENIQCGNATEYDLTGSYERELARRNMLREIAGDLDPQVFKSWTIQYDRGHVKDGREILYMKSRMAALLELHPELCSTIVSLFLTLPDNSKARPMLTGVLVLAGTSSAQQSLLTILSNRKIRKDTNFLHMLQMASLLQNPESTTADFYVKLINDPSEDSDVRYAAIYTVGSIVQKMNNQGKNNEADIYNRYLVERLGAACPAEETCALLFAMRNSRNIHNINVVKPFLQDRSEDVRFAATRALGAFNTEESTTLLIGRLDDRSYLVRNGILQSLLEHSLSGQDMAALRALTVNNTLKHETDPLLLELLQKEMNRYPQEALNILKAMQKRGIANQDVRYQVRMLINTLELNAATK